MGGDESEDQRNFRPLSLMYSDFLGRRPVEFKTLSAWISTEMEMTSERKPMPIVRADGHCSQN